MIKIKNVCYTIIICLFVSLISIKATLTLRKPLIKTVTVQNYPPKFKEINDDSVLNQINKLKIKYPKIALAQAKLESNNYRSKLFKKQYNLFGMTKVNSRPTTSENKHTKYASYHNYIESITDYALYQASIIHKIKSETQYYTYLSKYYATDRNYVHKLKMIVDTL